MITAIEMLKLINEKRAKLSSLKKCLKKYPQILINVCVDDKKPIKETETLRKGIAIWERKLRNKGRLYIRYSGTEPFLRIMVEAHSKPLADEAALSLARIAEKELAQDA